MQAFRKLAKNVFFKIVLAIVGLSFVLFGISGFLTGMPNSWVLKIGNEKISVNSFQKALELDKKIIRSAKGSNPQIEEYLASTKFSQDVANRLVRKTLIQKVSSEIGAFGSKDLILKTIAKDPNFQDKDGKFDNQKFKQFLSTNGLDDERYVQEVANEVSAEMIVQSLSMALPVNFKNALELEEFGQEKRIADVIVISKDNVQNITPPTDEELNKFHTENKTKYKTKELREVSLIEINAKSFEQNLTVSLDEINKFYEENLKTLFTLEENKDFYHLVFEDQKSAEEFSAKLNESLDKSKSNLKEQFAKLAKQIQKKSLKDITIEKVFKNTLPAEIAKSVNVLKINELSPIVKSELGFHIFLLNSVNPEQQIKLETVKDKISDKIIANKKEKISQETIAKINDSLMIAKSLDEVASKFNLKIVKLNEAIDSEGLNTYGKNLEQAKNFNDFAKNAFSAKQNQPSKLFSTQEPNLFYALEVNKIIASRDPEFNEIKSKLTTDFIDTKKQSELNKLVQQIQKEIRDNPSQALAIASKNGLKVERNKTYPRNLYIDLGSSKMPYKNQFLEELFLAKLGSSTPAVSSSQSEYLIGIVRNINPAKLASNEVIEAKKRAVEIFANDIMMEYNDYLQKKYPIEINSKYFGQKS
ncbi:MAG: hypothetical protein EBS92_04965 [Proteobacteria bacterium]|nr:hypothetical protein [Pseudomonadota bacterium]